MPNKVHVVQSKSNVCYVSFTQATEDFKALYNGNVMVEVITMSGNVHKVVRKGRSLLQAEDVSTSSTQFSSGVSYLELLSLIFPWGTFLLWWM